MKSIVWLGLVLGAVCVAGKVFYAKPSQTVILECAGNILARSLVWHHENQRIISVDLKSGFQRKESRYYVRATIRQVINLELSGVGEEDAGLYICDTGTKHEHTLVVVSASIDPAGELEAGSRATLRCRVKGLDSGYTVQWSRPPESTPAGTESGEVELTSVASSDAGTWTCVVGYNGETHTEKLELRVKAQTTTTSPSPPRNSKPACPHCVTKPAPAPDTFHWWVWVAVGVGCLVVILLMVFVIVMCKRIRRRKRRFQKMKNGRQLKGPKQYCQCQRPTAAARPQQGRRKGKPSTLHVQPLLIE